MGDADASADPGIDDEVNPDRKLSKSLLAMPPAGAGTDLNRDATLVSMESRVSVAVGRASTRTSVTDSHILGHAERSSPDSSSASRGCCRQVGEASGAFKKLLMSAER